LLGGPPSKNGNTTRKLRGVVPPGNLWKRGGGPAQRGMAPARPGVAQARGGRLTGRRAPSSCVPQCARLASCCTRNAPSSDAYGAVLCIAPARPKPFCCNRAPFPGVGVATEPLGPGAAAAVAGGGCGASAGRATLAAHADRAPNRTRAAGPRKARWRRTAARPSGPAGQHRPAAERSLVLEHEGLVVPLALAQGHISGCPDLGPGQARLLADALVELDHELGVVREELLGVLPALAQLLALVRVPGARLLGDPQVDGDVEQRALTTDALAVHDVELGLLEGRGHLVLHHLDPGAVPHHLHPVLDGLDAADVEPDRRVELQRPAAR